MHALRTVWQTALRVLLGGQLTAVSKHVGGAGLAALCRESLPEQLQTCTAHGVTISYRQSQGHA